MAETASISVVFVGRQTIYNSELDAVAYELLFRGSHDNRASFTDGDQATAELIINSFAEIGLDRITGGLPAFVNVPRNFLLERHAYSLPKDRVVLEVLEDVEPGPDVLDALSELRDDGYTIAIDDFVYRRELLPLVDIANIVKVEFPALTQKELEEHVKLLRERGVRILAEKIETYDEFDRCKELGFDYYQGFFFAKPKVIKGQSIPVNKVAVLRLITKLQNRSVAVEDVADVVRTEPSLSYKLLRFVNSSFCAPMARIESIQHAVTMAGMQRIKTFCSLSLLGKAMGNKPLQLIQMALSRAKMCELLAMKLNFPLMKEQLFLVGLFSAIDAFLDRPLNEALELVPLSSDIKRALLGREGIMGTILKCVLEYEQGHWENVKCRGLDADVIRNAYLDAINWSARAATDAMTGK